MRLYYSNAPIYLGEQQDSNKSLGGFISRTPIQNSVINNIFGDISFLGFSRKNTDTKLIVLKNETNSIKKVEMYLDIPVINNVDYKIALVKPNQNIKGELFFEQITESKSKPFYAEFQYVTGELNKIIFDIEKDMYIGIWVSREYLPIKELIVVKEQVFLRMQW